MSIKKEHTQGIKNAEMNLQINSKLVNSHRAILCGPQDKIHLHFSGQDSFGLAPVSCNLHGCKIVHRWWEAQMTWEGGYCQNLALIRCSISMLWMDAKELLNVLELKLQLIHCTFIGGTICWISALPAGLWVLLLKYPQCLEQCLVCSRHSIDK